VVNNRDAQRVKILKLWLSGIPVSHIASQYGRHPNTIRNLIHQLLTKYQPKPRPKPNDYCNMVVDTTWFGKEICLTLYWDHNQQYLQWWRYGLKELSEPITTDFKALRCHKVICTSTTTDSSKIILKSIEAVYPGIPKQRCLIHIHRESLNWLTRNPTDKPSQELVVLINQLLKIYTKQVSEDWIKSFSIWKKRWIKRLYQQRGERYNYSKKVSRILRVASYINRSLDGLFCYLDNLEIPWNTNGLEGRLSALKQHYRQHRGLSQKLLESYFGWYIHLIINKSNNLPT
jgi:hypothetical protein